MLERRFLLGLLLRLLGYEGVAVLLKHFCHRSAFDISNDDCADGHRNPMVVLVRFNLSA